MRKIDWAGRKYLSVKKVQKTQGYDYFTTFKVIFCLNTVSRLSFIDQDSSVPEKCAAQTLAQS